MKIENKYSISLKNKIEYSINLLLKSEQMALDFDPCNGFSLAFSGGKDSQALYHIAVMAGVKFKAHMNLTSVDPPEVIRFVKKNYPDVSFNRPKISIYNMAKNKNVLPTQRIRWCCAEYKEMNGDGKITLLGIRKAESVRRSKREEVSTSIKGKRNEQTFDQFSEHKETMIGCVRGNDKIMISPIINWTDNDVWNFLNINAIKHCELYDNGYSRIGCILCPMANIKVKRMDIEKYPHVKKNWIKVIQNLIDTGHAPKEVIENGTEFGFEWWLSGKSLSQFCAENISQLKIKF